MIAQHNMDGGYKVEDMPIGIVHLYIWGRLLEGIKELRCLKKCFARNKIRVTRYGSVGAWRLEWPLTLRFL